MLLLQLRPLVPLTKRGQLEEECCLNPRQHRSVNANGIGPRIPLIGAREQTESALGISWRTNHLLCRRRQKRRKPVIIPSIEVDHTAGPLTSMMRSPCLAWAISDRTGYAIRNNGGALSQDAPFVSAVAPCSQSHPASSFWHTRPPAIADSNADSAATMEAVAIDNLRV